ncbi:MULTISPECIES: hypothetical protein [Moraxella]|uniref:Uncharacterized protein n=1 Tax=Moraxella catarrhalis TaxID=480 RepID=A0A7Z0V0C0_MORCA|nr:hypothetical protein [Moraxella catarrhalis]OAV01855.1 hypothetical protein AO382_0221 [Moraxella catarrhalis]STY82216.1 Uncharacterised protein [Moraxella catarrhalis]
MNWLKNLPLEQIGEALAGFFSFWGRLTEGVPAGQLPLIVYVVCCGLVLLLWLVIMRLIPRPFKGISLVVLAAVMFAPGQAAGDTGEIAPAMIGVFHAILMKDFGAALGAAVPIFAALAALLVVGAAWQMARGAIAANAEKEVQALHIQQQKRLLDSDRSN